jgi:hypothetical protein
MRAFEAREGTVRIFMQIKKDGSLPVLLPAGEPVTLSITAQRNLTE